MKKILIVLMMTLLIPSIAFAGQFNSNYSEPNFSEAGTLSKTADYTIVTADKNKVIRVTASSADITITLPSISSFSNGFSVKVLKTDATDYKVTLARASSDTIDGVTAYVVANQNDFIIVSTDNSGKDWEVIYADEIAGVDVTTGITTFGGSIVFGGGLLLPNESTTTTDTLTASQCGSTVTLNSATGYVTTLPAPTAGCGFTFYASATPPTSGNHTVVTDSSANVIDGSLIVAGAVVACATEDTVSFVASTAISGDNIVLYSDGTSWFVSSDATSTGGITCTAT